MATQVRVLPGFYRDSVSLMQIAAAVAQDEGVLQFSAFMATENNIDLLRNAGLLSGSVEAGPNDLLLAAEAALEESLPRVLDKAEKILRRPPAKEGKREEAAPRSIVQAVGENPDRTLALIATPGGHAASEALKALRMGLNVMIFSDNVSLEDEILLKKEAAARNLLVMGPDCGTAIIDGAPLAFANAVRRGNIGLAGASGTGLQHVSCRIHILGGGISHALGTGGRDLKENIGGVSMLACLDALAEDAETKVAVIISKPPAPSVMRTITDKARNMNKPVVALFLGAENGAQRQGNIHFANTLEEAASMACALAGGNPPPQYDPKIPELPSFAAGQKYVRGLFSGGTFCYEASILLGKALPGLKSNTPVTKDMALADSWKSEGNCLVDLGDDEFTRGRPHPMIDQRLRCARIIKEAQDPGTAVILFDMVLGYGAHPDPAEELSRAIGEGRAKAQAEGLSPVFVAYVCGTEKDPQSFCGQCRRLEETGVILAPSNASAVRTALKILTDRVS